MLYDQRAILNIMETAASREERTPKGKLWGTKDRGILDQTGQCYNLCCPPVEAREDHKWWSTGELHGCASGSKDPTQLLFSLNYPRVSERMGLHAKESDSASSRDS